MFAVRRQHRVVSALSAGFGVRVPRRTAALEYARGIVVPWLASSGRAAAAAAVRTWRVGVPLLVSLTRRGAALAAQAWRVAAPWCRFVLALGWWAWRRPNVRPSLAVAALAVALGLILSH
jgi:hypothetical protein